MLNGSSQHDGPTISSRASQNFDADFSFSQCAPTPAGAHSTTRRFLPCGHVDLSARTTQPMERSFSTLLVLATHHESALQTLRRYLYLLLGTVEQTLRLETALAHCSPHLPFSGKNDAARTTCVNGITNISFRFELYNLHSAALSFSRTHAHSRSLHFFIYSA